jgi:hypothetical protein
VYIIPDTTKINPTNSKVIIEYNNGSKCTDRQLESPKNTYINLLGLDIMDKNNNLVQNGDGSVDFNYFIIDSWKNLIIFPLLQPFDPNESSRFYLNKSNRAKIYDIPANDLTSLINESKFRIVIELYD